MKITPHTFTSSDFTGMLLLRALIFLGNEKCDSLIKVAHENGHLEVVLTINDIEVSVLDLFKSLEKSLDEWVAQEALEESQRRCNNILNRISDFETSINDLIREKFPEIPPEYDD